MQVLKYTLEDLLSHKAWRVIIKTVYIPVHTMYIQHHNKTRQKLERISLTWNKVPTVKAAS